VRGLEVRNPDPMERLRRAFAFTLIELLVVILVLGILIAVAVPAYLGQKEKAEDAVAKQYLTVAYKAAKAATVVEPYSGSYPTPASTLRQRLEEIEPGVAFSTGQYCSNASGVDGVVVDSDDSSAALLKLYGESDSGKIFQLTASATGSPQIIQACSAPVVGAGAGAPQISGTKQVGQQLTVSNGSNWESDSPLTYTYQWQNCGTTGDDCEDISGATAQNYVVQAADEGDLLRVVVTAANVAGSATQETPTTTTVLPAPPVMSGTGPTVSGTYQEGMVLTASPGSWGGTGPISYTYQWQRCGATLASCQNIADATSQSYTLTVADVDSRVAVVVFATNAGGTTSARSDGGDPSSLPLVISSLPIGAVVAYAGQSVPSGWLLADGTAVSRSTYSELFAETGTTYGAGNGSTTFNLPNLSGKLPLGKATAGAAATLGATGGALDSSGAVSLGSATSNFSWTDSPANPSFVAKTHTWNAESAVAASDYPWVGMHNTIGPVTFTTTESGTVTPRAVSASGTATMTGSYTATNVPFRTVRYIVKAATTAQLPACAVVSSAATATPAGATNANGSAASGALAACLDPAFAGNTPNLEGRFALGQATAGTGSALNAAGGQLAQTASVTRNQASTQMTVTPAPYNVNLTISSPAPTSLNYTNIATQYGANNWNGVCSPDPPSCSTANSRGPIGPFGSAYSPSVGSDHGAVVASNTYAPSLTTSQAPAATVTSTSYSAPYVAVNFYAGLTSSKTGDLMPFAGTSLPQGYLRANGDCYSTSTYANLFSAIGYTYGGSGASFCVPDLGGKAPLGKASSGPASTLGATGGSLAATPSATFSGWMPSLTVPAHTFRWTTPNHTYNISGSMNGSLRNYCGTGGESCWQANLNQTIVRYTGYGTTYPSVSSGSQVVSSAGSTPTVNAASAIGAQTANLPAQSPPYQVVNYIIKD